MGFIVFEEEAFNYLDAQLENFVKRMYRIRERSEDKTMNKWLDTQDVCQTLNICPRTVQTLRDNGTLAYTQISHKTYYKPEDVMAIVAIEMTEKQISGRNISLNIDYEDVLSADSFSAALLEEE